MAEEEDRAGTPQEEGGARMTVGEHLEELRRRVLRALLYLGLALVVCLIFNDRIRSFILEQPFKVLRDVYGPDKAAMLVTGTVEGFFVYLKIALVVCLIFNDRIRGFILEQPFRVLRDLYGPDKAAMLVTGTVEGFFVYLKIALVAALLLASPLMAREVWGFVAAGLYPHEKKHVRVFAPISYLLFLGGVAFLYYLVLPTALNFLYTFGIDPEKTRMFPSYSQYVSFYITMSLVMGLVFQLPLIMLFFSAIGLITPSFFRKYRRHFIVGAVAALAVLTPTGDAMTLMLVSVPVVALYEGGILLGRLLTGRKREEEASG